MLYKTAVAILIILQDELLESDFGDIMNILKNTSKHITDEDKLVEVIRQVQIPDWIADELPKLESDHVLDQI